MNILNGDFDMAKSDPRAVVAFTRPPRRVLLGAGDQLYRFTSLPTPAFGGNELFKSPWWYPKQTFNSIVRVANRTGTALADTARSRLAVSRNWNPTMESLAIIELTKPVYAWAGPTRPQPVDQGDRSVMLLGNFDQLYVPGLAGAGNGTSSPCANVVFYGLMELEK
jgi:hypothetical protein